MEPPFFRSYFQTPKQQPPQRRAPVPTRQVPPKTTPPSQPRKVVSIPVHFVDCARNRPNAALKIQKAFRGFRVRKTVKKILELKREVDGVEKKLQERETMEAVKRDGMERLKINETLMNLLFRLDSVRGFNGEIRDFRKAVIKKAIRLQELLDSAVANEGDREMEEKDSGNCEGIDKSNCGSVKDSCDDSSKMCVDDSSEKVESEVLENSGANDDECAVDKVMESLADLHKMQVEEPEKITEESRGEINSDEIGDKTLENSEISNGEELKQGEILDNGEAWECVGEATGEQKSDFVEAGEEVDHGGAEGRREERKESSSEEWCVVGGGDKERERKEELLEKMAGDNEKLMAMVADLCQKNAAQTRVICSLSQRVEQLEKAMSERLRKKKKKMNNAVHS